MTSIEWLEYKTQNTKWIDLTLSERKEIIQQAKEMHKTEQENLYTEEQVREALFCALNIDRTTCCTTRTTDSIVREVIQSLKN